MKSIYTQLKKFVWERDNFTCHYCKQDMRALYQEWLDGKIKRLDALLSVDHVVPRCKGGRWTLQNLVTACIPCNKKKGSKLQYF